MGPTLSGGVASRTDRGAYASQTIEPFVHEERARLARLTGDPVAHERELREAQQLFQRIGATARATRLGAELALVED